MLFRQFLFLLLVFGFSALNVHAQEAVSVEPPSEEELLPQTDPLYSDEDLPEDKLFFDSEALVPEGELAKNTGPRKVNPRLEPGSRFVVVRKNYEFDSAQAGIVAAERAVKLGRYDSALTIYNNLLDEGKDTSKVLLGRAIALQKLGRVDEAVLAYETFLELQPENLEAQVNMLGLMSERFPAVSLRRLLTLFEGHKRNSGIAAQIAVVYARLNEYENAVRYLGIAAGMEPQNPLHFFNMAVIAEKTNNRDDAIRYYERALEVDTIHGTGDSIPREKVFERLSVLRS